jgi:hypothetical protein
MFRAMIGAAFGVALGMAALAGYAAWYGLTQGVDWRQPNLPPGFDAAAVSAATVLSYFWWAACGAGGVIGGLAGFGSWLVRPRESARLA